MLTRLSSHGQCKNIVFRHIIFFLLLCGASSLSSAFCISICDILMDYLRFSDARPKWYWSLGFDELLPVFKSCQNEKENIYEMSFAFCHDSLLCLDGFWYLFQTCTVTISLLWCWCHRPFMFLTILLLNLKTCVMVNRYKKLSFPFLLYTCKHVQIYTILLLCSELYLL